MLGDVNGPKVAEKCCSKSAVFLLGAGTPEKLVENPLSDYREDERQTLIPSHFLFPLIRDCSEKAGSYHDDLLSRLVGCADR